MEVAGCELPEELLYDLEESVWVRVEPSASEWTIGLIAAQLAFAGTVRSVTFRPDEGPIAAGRSVATVESVRYTGPVRVPAAGQVVARNEALRERPSMLNEAPYGAGWIARLRPDDPAPPARLESAGAVAERLRRRIAELRIRCWPFPPETELIELGTECAAILARLDEELLRSPDGRVILLVTDDPTSPIEMVRWQDRTGHTVLRHRREGPLEQFLIRKEPHPRPRARRAPTGEL